jgi:chemotaxis protein methyltransferase CheR
MSLSVDDFQFVSNLVKKRSGIFLSSDKAYLVDSRLLPIARKNSFTDVKDFIAKIKQNNDEKFISEVIEAMTTNESSFFRDIKPFEYFKTNAIPKMISLLPEKKHFRIWSSACSTGQEAYSLAITISENPAWSKYTFEIVATDIAQHVIDKALSGTYSQFEVQRGLPIGLLLKYFTQDGENWKISERVKSMVSFSKLNLIEDFTSLGKFDLIFCRNVLIYFEIETKMKILHNFSKMMDPHSNLVVGCSETIIGIDRFQAIKEAIGFYTLK